MLPELNIIKLLLNYEQWCKAREKFSADDLPKELQGIYRCLNTYHEGNEKHVDLSVSDLSNLYFASLPRDRDLAIRLFDQLNGDSGSETTVHDLIKGINRRKVLQQLSLDAYDAAEGRKPLSSVLERLGQLSVVDGEQDDGKETQGEEEFVTDDLDVLVHDSIKKPGLRWRLQTLNLMLGSLRKGDFGFIFARPETGKTTFLASEVSHMASQLKDEDGPIIWFNNEEQGSKVMLRLYQAVLGYTMTELYRDLNGAKKLFYEITKRKILLLDDAGLSKRKVEAICERYKPSLIIFDQIDKIKGFDNDREDLRLGSIYQWARELAKKYAPAVGVCQADGTGENVQWLTMAHVANAKTAKQAEADWILGIGKRNEPGYDTIRYLHASKNKLLGDEDTNPEWRHGRKEVLIDQDRARYKDMLE